jgi:imidazolonepropionase-like amidohydrolase
VALYLDQANAGTVAEGNVSDLVLLNANPLDDISNSKSIEGVMIGAKWLPRDSLDARLSKLVKQ